MLNRRSTAAASRWLRRRSAEGVAAATPAEAALVLRDNLARAAASDDGGAVADRASSDHLIPAALLHQVEQQRRQHSDDGGDSAAFLRQCLPSLHAARQPRDFSVALQKYMHITARLVSSPSIFPSPSSCDAVANKNSSSSSSTNTLWLDALDCFLNAVATQGRANRSFRSLALDSSPDWGAAWVLLCRQTLDLASASATSSPQQQRHHHHHQFVASVSLCDAVTRAILPLASESVQQTLRSDCCRRIERLRGEMHAEELAVADAVQRAAATGKYTAVLRAFLLSSLRTVGGASAGGGDGSSAIGAATEAALSALRKLLATNDDATDAAAVREIVCGGSISRLVLPLDAKASAKRIVDDNFAAWCGSSVSPLLVIANHIVVGSSTTVDGAPANAVVDDLLRSLADKAPRAASDVTASPTAQQALGSIVRHLASHLSAFGDGAATLAASAQQQQEQEQQKKKNVLPVLASLAKLVARGVASKRYSGGSDDESESKERLLASAWQTIVASLSLSASGASVVAPTEGAHSAADTLTSLIRLATQEQHQHAAQRDASSLLRRSADILRVCLLSEALRLSPNGDEALVEPLLLRAVALEAAPAASSAAASPLVPTSHVAVLLRSRASWLLQQQQQQLLQRRATDEESVRVARDVLRLPLLAVALLKQQVASTSAAVDATGSLAAHAQWLQNDAAALAALVKVPTPAASEAGVASQQLWQLCLRAFSGSSSTSAALTRALLSNSMWREALSVCSGAEETQRLCQQLLALPYDAASSSSSSRWQLAVAILSEMSFKQVNLRPRTLVSVLQALHSPSTPHDVALNMTIQMARPHRQQQPQPQAQAQQQNQEPDVVNLLVSVSRAVMHQQQQQQDDAESSAEAESSPLLRARVMALSGLLLEPFSSSASATPGAVTAGTPPPPPQQQHFRFNRRIAGSLRAALLLCAETGDWQSAFFLISTISKQQQQQNQQQPPQQSASYFTLAPDVVWKLTRALEQAGQEARTDALRQYVASQDVSRWLGANEMAGADVETKLQQQQVQAADANLHDTLPTLPELSRADGGRASDGGKRSSGGSSSSDAAALAVYKSATDQLFDGIHAAEYIRLRSSAIQKLAAIGKWRLAASILATMSSKLSLVGPDSPSSSSSAAGIAALQDSATNRSLLVRAIAAAVFVCATRNQWSHALAAFLMHRVQRQRRHVGPLPPPAMIALVRGLARAGRWSEAVGVFASLQQHHSAPINGGGGSNSNSSAILLSLFASLTRACRVSRSWEAALLLHGARPDLVSFASAGEVVAACSAAGFPLTKIQLWISMRERNLFLVSTANGAESGGGYSDDVTETTAETTTTTAAAAQAAASSATLSALDVSVFFALLNAQSHAAADAPSGERDVWRRSLSLLQSCWMGQSVAATSGQSDSVAAAPLRVSQAAFDAARAPDCVASVMDTCIRQGQWQHAFALHRMQRLLLIPMTPHSVYFLLTAMLHRIGPESSAGVSTSSPSPAAPFTWKSAMRLVADAVSQQRAAGNPFAAAGGASSPKVLQPLVCERLVQVLCRGGAWERALEFAHFAGPSMGNLMTNDRVLDSFVAHSDNARVVCAAAAASGTFPMSAQHELGRRVEQAVVRLLDQGEQPVGAAAMPTWQVALETLKACIKNSPSHSALSAADQAKIRLAAFRRQPTQHQTPRRVDVEAWLASIEQQEDHQQHNANRTPTLACDIAFAKLSLSLMVVRQQAQQERLHAEAEALLRYTMLFGVPTREELRRVWPRLLKRYASGDVGFVLLRKVNAWLRQLADEMP